MIVTLTSKGQLTLPKAIRDELQLHAGAKLDFVVDKDGTLRVRPLRPLSSLFGLLHRPGMKPLTVADIDAAIGEYVSAEDERIKNQAGSPKKRVGRSSR
jgi:AbrB family looped-hinge helix DNA binding protein